MQPEMDDVFIVLRGEMSEGGRVESVHASRDTAITAALATSTCFAGGWKPDGDYSWANGCDFVKVERWEVEP